MSMWYYNRRQKEASVNKKADGKVVTENVATKPNVFTQSEPTVVSESKPLLKRTAKSKK